MAQPTYRLRGIVLRRTKLGETDLILTLLAQDGSQVRAVAKGARKPTSSFAARTELYSVIDCLVAQGKSLDIVKEVRLVASNQRLRGDLEHAAAAAPMAELLDRESQLGLQNPRLFAMTQAAFEALGDSAAAQAPALTAAHLAKALAFSGLRPSLDRCVGCGCPVSLDDAAGSVPFSYSEGGVACPACRPHCDCVATPIQSLSWLRALMLSTFAEIGQMDVPAQATFAVLHVLQLWIRQHVGANLKSLNFLFTCGLF